jgi:CMP-N,N'-diacetyllegionaminic acid synthase
LGGRPLIVWSLDVAKNIPEICDILVSTDDEAIAVVSKNAGAFVLWLPPAKIATNTISSVDVALHAQRWYEAKKGLVDGILQSISPLRNQNTLKRGIEMFRKHNRLPVLEFVPTERYKMWTLRIKVILWSHLLKIMD